MTIPGTGFLVNFITSAPTRELVALALDVSPSQIASIKIFSPPRHMQFRTSLRSSTVKLKILGHAKKANGALRFDPKRTNMVLLTTQGRERFRYGMKDLDSSGQSH